MLGHELRNPLAPILTAVELLGRHPTAVRERNVIERHTRHLARLVDDLLDISRVTRGHVELHREHVSLASVLERALEMAAPLLSRNQHHLHVDNAGDVKLHGDSVRLAQIFGNLLTNAAKFTAPDGKIEVLIDRVPGRVRVSVRDNGCGIAPDQMTRIFEPFVQADRERDALRGGLGLGLAIVRNLVQRHDGTVSVRSEGHGRGTVFTVDLPIATGIELPKPIVQRQPSGARAGVRILVVDDNIDLAQLLSEALQEEGFETCIAHDGRGALTSWRSFLPHAGVFDVGLPDVDGYELAKTLRAEYGDNATLIAATGYGRPTDQSRAAEAGFDCLLVKPVSVNDLVLVLDQRVVARERRDVLEA
jgi:CheY-like chemotaxis protein